LPWQPVTRAQAAALKTLHLCVQHAPEAAGQAREAGWLHAVQELLAAAPAGTTAKPFSAVFCRVGCL
jgi:hypothetical protein